MSPNQILVRDLVAVVTAIALITTVALVLGRPSSETEVPTAGRSTPAPSAGPASLVELGARLYQTKGCVACHSTDGSPRVGPTFKGAYGSTVVLGDGITLVFDEQYVRESLAHPQAQARPGYPPSMPSFDGMLTDREVAAVIAYIESLR